MIELYTFPLKGIFEIPYTVARQFLAWPSPDDLIIKVINAELVL